MSLTKIKILPENIANKIAAGEVVQRPESVVKELLENSIDAGAKNIELIIKRAGKSLIQVVDDGEGMNDDDALLSLQRHATSKIYSYEDLEKIKTFGFRGEALSSVSAVSQIEIKTETRENEIGVYLRSDDGQNISTEKGSFAKGTSISVKNLFYNTPARRNFLKSDATELKHIIDVFNREALSNPQIAFKFYNDDDEIFNYPAGSREDRIKSVFADNIFDVLIEVKELTELISIHGYTAKPNFLKKNKGEQYLYVNNRFVISRQINHAIFSAYEHLLEKGDYPFFILFLDIDPSRVDINVHPSKMEIKFDREKDIYSIVLAVMKKSIGSYDLIPSASLSGTANADDKIVMPNIQRTIKQAYTSDDRSKSGSSPEYFKRDSSGSPSRNFTDEDIDLLFSSINQEVKKPAGEAIPGHPFKTGGEDNQNKPDEKPEVSSKEPEISAAGQSAPFIIQLHNKYILSQIRSGLMIIDQHVAHERILYEKILRALEANMPFSQQLLFSQTLVVDAGDYALIKELLPFLNKMGFEIKLFGKNTVVIDGVPQDIKFGSEEFILKDILDEFRRNQSEKRIDDKDNLAASFACKAAIKAGDRLTEREMRLLVDQLFATTMPYVCPHGRPVIVKIPLDEFDKRFGRTS